jgi:hypothetical protein
MSKSNRKQIIQIKLLCIIMFNHFNMYITKNYMFFFFVKIILYVIVELDELNDGM